MVKENAKIICRNLWKVFGPNPDSIWGLVDEGKSKQEVLDETGHVIAVKDVSFEVRENEIFVVMGLSGSGKSTLVRCINYLIKPTRGNVIIDGADLSQMDDNELREIRRHKLGMVFQHFGLLPHRSVLDNASFALEVRGEHGREKEEKVAKALELVGLNGWENSMIHELSGGMQQRVGLARALAADSEVLFMDEPFSALDPLIRRQMQDEFINLRAKLNVTVLFITHDLLEALKLGDRIAIMKDGEIIQMGTPEEIVSQPTDDYVSEFVKDVPRGRVITARSIMEEPAVVIRSNRDIETCVSEMAEKRIPVAYIVGPFNTLQGMITMKEAIAIARKGPSQAGDVARQDFPQTSPDTPLDDILHLVAEGNIPVAVVDEDRRLLGMVTRTELIRALQSDNETTD